MSDAERVEELFHKARNLGPEARAEFLTASCGEDAALRKEVEELLGHTGGEAGDLRGMVREAAASLGEWQDQSGGDNREGLRLGAFRLTQKIGEGGMGAVWLGRREDGLFEQQVAVKFILRGHFPSAHQQERFLRERRVLAQLNHPHIARILDGGATPDGEPYIVMEYIEGEPITRHCLRGELPLAARLRLWLDACAAASYAHGKGIVHRDIKPANLLVTGDGVLKLLDFGIAKPKADAALTVTGAAWGSPIYWSPEQAAGEEVDERSDVYSLGVVLLELLTGKPTLPINLDKTTSSSPPIPRELRLVLRRALAGDRAERYSSVAEMMAEVRPLVLELELAGSGRSRQWSRGVLAAAAGVCLVALAAGAWWRFGPGNGGLSFSDVEWRNVTNLGDARWVTASPDRKSFVYLRADRSLWLKRASTASATRIVKPEQYAGSTYFMSVSPDGEWVYFNTSNNQLLRVPLLGGVPQVVREQVSNFDFSPDGAHCVYLATDRAETPLYVAAANLSQPHLLLRQTAPLESAFRWASDSRYINYVHSDGIPGGGRWANRVAVGSGVVEQLFDVRKYGRILRLADMDSGAWLINGTDAASGLYALWYVRKRTTQRLSNPLGSFKLTTKLPGMLVGTQERLNQTLQLWDASQGVLRQISQGSGSFVDGQYLRDGRIVALVRSGPLFELWILQADGTPERQILETQEFINDLAVSPGRDEILFTWRKARSYSLWRVGLDGSGLERLLPDEGVYQPAISPDGKRLAYAVFVKGRFIVREAMRATPGQMLWEAEGNRNAMSYSPGSDQLLFQRGPDGQSMVIARKLDTGGERVLAEARLPGVSVWSAKAPFLEGEGILSLGGVPRPYFNAYSLATGQTRRVWEGKTPEPCWGDRFSIRPDGGAVLIAQICAVVDGISLEDERIR